MMTEQVSERELIEAIEQIAAARLPVLREGFAHVLVVIKQWERKHVAKGGKPLHEMTVAEIIKAARQPVKPASLLRVIVMMAKRLTNDEVLRLVRELIEEMPTKQTD